MQTTNTVATAPVAAKTGQNEQLVIFQFTKPAVIPDLLNTKERLNKDGKVAGVSLTAATRKDIAASLGVTVKDAKVGEKLNALNDDMKKLSASEVMAIMSNPDWTGKRIAASVNKSGVQTRTFAFQTRAGAPVMDLAKIEAALSKMSPKDAEATIAKLSASVKEHSSQAKAIEVK